MTIKDVSPGTPGSFTHRYGPWAVIAGASEGLGAAFARALARQGLNLLLLARRPQPLEELKTSLGAASSVEIRTRSVDLGAPDAAEQVLRATADLEVGVFVYNAAWSPIGRFTGQSPEDQLRAIDVNVRTPTVLAHHFARTMAARGRGAILLLSSLTAFQGSPFVATYGATKAYNLCLGEALWYELKDAGVDVLAVCPGVTKTPGLLKASPGGGPGILEPEQVAHEALAVLGRQPYSIPGVFNRFVSFLLRFVMPRHASVRLMGSQTKRLLVRRAP